MRIAVRLSMKAPAFAAVCSLALVAACSGGSASAPAPGMTGVASTAVQNCPYKPGFSTPMPVTMPSTVPTTYGVHLPSGASFFGVEAYSSHGAIPYFFVGPVGSSCSVIYAGDGGEDMSAIDGRDNATTFEELYPSGVPTGYEIACYTFPDMAGDIEGQLGKPCPKDTNITTWNLTTESTPGKKFDPNLNEYVGLAKMSPGNAPNYLSDFESASKQFTTWQLSLFGSDTHWIACAVPQSDTDLCVGTFQYFLAETTAADGLKLPTQSAIGTLIRDHIHG